MNNTLLPVLEKHGKSIDEALEEVIADSGYWSEKISCKTSISIRARFAEKQGTLWDMLILV